MAEAARVTATGFDAAFRGIRAGLNEFDLQEMIEHAYRTNGARDLAFRTIAGGGFNATVLHYHANDQALVAGELVVVDSGAAHAGYSADVTRTIPVSGTFTPRQRELYEIVLKSQLAGIAAVRVGATLMSIDAAARAVINKAGLGDAEIAEAIGIADRIRQMPAGKVLEAAQTQLTGSTAVAAAACCEPSDKAGKSCC